MVALEVSYWPKDAFHCAVYAADPPGHLAAADSLYGLRMWASYCGCLGAAPESGCPMAGGA